MEKKLDNKSTIGSKEHRSEYWGSMNDRLKYSLRVTLDQTVVVYLMTGWYYIRGGVKERF